MPSSCNPFCMDIARELGNTRYNGGWTKTVTGIDKCKANGYSLSGEFIGQGVRPVYPGLYLDCDISGSRKNQVKTYYLAEITFNGKCVLLDTQKGTSGYDRLKTGRDWAVRLWPAIDAYFEKMQGQGESG